MDAPLGKSFENITFLLKEAFENCVSEPQYFYIVTLMRKYKMATESLSVDDLEIEKKKQKKSLKEIGWPEEYDLIFHTENIRWGLCLSGTNERIAEFVNSN